MSTDITKALYCLKCRDGEVRFGHEWIEKILNDQTNWDNPLIAEWEGGSQTLKNYIAKVIMETVNGHLAWLNKYGAEAPEEK